MIGRRRTRPDAFALPLTLLLCLILAAFGAVLFQQSRTVENESVFYGRRMKARAIADAGLEAALLELRADPRSRGRMRREFAGGAYEVEVTGQSPPWVVSTGIYPADARVGAARATVRVQSAILEEPGCDAFADRDVTVQGTVETLSALSPGRHDPADWGRLCANRQASVSPAGGKALGCRVDYGEGDAPNSFLVAGPVALLPYPLPAPVYRLDAYVDQNRNVDGIAPSSAYNEKEKTLEVPLGQTVTLTDGLFYFRRLTVNGTLEIAPRQNPVIVLLDGPLETMRLGGNGAGEIRNISRLPFTFFFIVMGSRDVSLEGKERLFVHFEIPEGTVHIRQELQGTVVAKNIVVEREGSLILDHSAPPMLVTRVSWVPGSWSPRAPAGYASRPAASPTISWSDR